MVNSQNSIQQVRSGAWTEEAPSRTSTRWWRIIMAYYSGTHIVSELMLVKDDREVDA